MKNSARKKLWTSAEVSKIFGKKNEQEWEATGVSIDSRKVQPGDLFIAIVGKKNDGHEFLPAVFKKGAAAAIVQDVKKFSVSNVLGVKDTLVAMDKMASHARSRSEAQVIAVTGSVGKTGTKEMLSHILSGQGQVSATKGNLNNQFGLPLSLMRMPKNTDYGVFELGMRGPGEIKALAEITAPDVGIITSIDLAHKQYFESIVDIANAKAEIMAGMSKKSTIILNRDSSLFDHLSSIAKSYGLRSIETFGFDKKSSYRILETLRSKAGTIIKADLRGKLVEFEVGIHGVHSAKNAMAALAAVEAVGGDIASAALMLREVSAIKGRGRIQQISLQSQKFILIDESYNANPASMSAALSVLGEFPIKNKGRRIAVLGDMLELGSHSSQLHKELLDVLQNHCIDQVFVTGQEMSKLWEILPKGMCGGWAETVQDLSKCVTSHIRSDDVVMIKGSYGTGIGKIVLDLAKIKPSV